MRLLVLLSAFLFTALPAYAQPPFERIETDAGILGLSLTNYGTIGKPDVRNNPEGGSSMRYPVDTGTEHLFEAGLWLGAVFNNSAIRVSTAAVTAAGGYARGAAGFEFTANSPISQRASDPGNEFFSPFAVSEQDIIAEFTDQRQVVNNVPISGHDTPLFADVRMESYNWSFPFTENFSIIRYDITNNSELYDAPADWDSIFVGMYCNLVVRNVNTTVETGTDFFNKNGLGYIDSLYTTYVFDAGSGDNPSINTYAGLSIIGAEYNGEYFHPSNAEYLESIGLRAPFVDPSYWLFSAGAGIYGGLGNGIANDEERYRRMSSLFPLDELNGSTTAREQLRTDGQQANGNYIAMLSIGPFPKVRPGETISVYYAYSASLKPDQFQDLIGKRVDNEESQVELVNTVNSINRVFQGEDRNNNGVLDEGEDSDGNGELTRYLFPTPPDDPNLRIELEAGKAVLYWDKAAERSVDRVSGEQDFEGYRVYRSELGEDLNPQARLIREFDTDGNDVGFNTGFSEIELETPVTFEGDTTTYYYAFEINDLLSGWQYELSVTAFDNGSDVFEIESLETSPNVNGVRVFPGTPVNANFGSDSDEFKVGVYPNPYRINAAWDGNLENERKLNFYNLPAKAEVKIYSISGDIIASFEHDSDTYQGEGGWYNSFSSEPRLLAGGEHSWDIQSNANQILTSGLYLYSVRDLSSGEVQTGKLVIIK
ncbi:MAG: hypothetical protein AAFW89_13055 [Bacteroidota bacterium]